MSSVSTHDLQLSQCFRQCQNTAENVQYLVLKLSRASNLVGIWQHKKLDLLVSSFFNSVFDANEESIFCVLPPKVNIYHHQPVPQNRNFTNTKVPAPSPYQLFPHCEKIFGKICDNPLAITSFRKRHIFQSIKGSPLKYWFLMVDTN